MNRIPNEKIVERAIFNATHKMDTTDLCDALNQAGMDDFLGLLVAYKSGDTVMIGNCVTSIINNYVKENLVDFYHAFEQLIEERNEGKYEGKEK